MTCLFVGNITKSLTEQKLVNIFSKVGPCQVELKVLPIFILINPNLHRVHMHL